MHAKGRRAAAAAGPTTTRRALETVLAWLALLALLHAAMHYELNEPHIQCCGTARGTLPALTHPAPLPRRATPRHATPRHALAASSRPRCGAMCIEAGHAKGTQHSLGLGTPPWEWRHGGARRRTRA